MQATESLLSNFGKTVKLNLLFNAPKPAATLQTVNVAFDSFPCLVQKENKDMVVSMF